MLTIPLVSAPAQYSADWTGASLGDSIAVHVNEVLSRPLVYVFPGWSRPPSRLWRQKLNPYLGLPSATF
jgi:hypothetical protein